MQLLTGYLPTTSASLSGITGVTRGGSGTTAATASSGGVVTIGSTSTTLAAAITATQDYIPLASLTGVAASGTASIGTSNMDLNLSSSGTGSVKINEIKTNSVTGEVIPGKLGGTNFTDSLLIGHSTTGTLNNEAYKSLMSMKVKGMNVNMYYSGDTENIDEVIAFGYSKNTGVGVARLLGKKMNPLKIIETLSSTVSGQSNIGLGWSAGNNITSGDGNVVIGNGDVASATGDKQLKISDGVDGSIAWM